MGKARRIEGRSSHGYIHVYENSTPKERSMNDPKQVSSNLMNFYWNWDKPGRIPKGDLDKAIAKRERRRLRNLTRGL